MIKFIIQHYNQYNECVNSDDPADCPIKGAVLEEWVETQSIHVSASLEYVQEARLDAAGNPFIYSEKKYTPYNEFRGWEKFGFDHTSEKFEPEGSYPYWIYSRKINTSAWTFTVETLEQIEDFLDKEYELGRLDTPINGIQYYIEVNE